MRIPVLLAIIVLALSIVIPMREARILPLSTIAPLMVLPEMAMAVLAVIVPELEILPAAEGRDPGDLNADRSGRDHAGIGDAALEGRDSVDQDADSAGVDGRAAGVDDAAGERRHVGDGYAGLRIDQTGIGDAAGEAADTRHINAAGAAGDRAGIADAAGKACRRSPKRRRRSRARSGSCRRSRCRRRWCQSWRSRR